MLKSRRYPRNPCYCSLWKTKPETLAKQGLPKGYCGICEVCGQPGHTMHAPTGPYTSSWCDEHFSELVERLIAEGRIKYSRFSRIKTKYFLLKQAIKWKIKKHFAGSIKDISH